LPQSPEITEEWLELLKSAKLNRALPFSFVGQIPKQQVEIQPKPNNNTLIDNPPNPY
jgi:hypothetical protein